MLLPIFLAAWAPRACPPAAADIEGRDMGCSFCTHPPNHPWHYHGCRYYGLGLDSGKEESGGSSDYAGSGDPMLDAMAPHLQRAASQLGEALGQALTRALFGDPDQKRRQAEIDAWRQAREQERLKSERAFQRDMLDKHTEELAHLRGERHRKILARLKRLGGGIFSGGLEASDPSVVDLRPGGSSFFGMGGSGTWDDPMVVDLRHFGQGTALARKAAGASPEDAGILLDEGFRAARGGGSFLSGAGDAPVDGKSLLAFQKANADYAKAHDFRAQVTRHEQTELQAAGLSDEAARKAKAATEAAKAAGADPARVEELRQQSEGLFAKARLDREAWDKARAEADAASTDSALRWQDARRSFEDAAAGRKPGEDPFAKAPPSSLEEKTWKGFQEKMIAGRQEAETRHGEVLRDLDALAAERRTEPPPPKVHVHEGVILGTFTTQEGADTLVREGVSPFTGKSYQDMNESRFWNEEGRQGALAVSFGTPEGTPGYAVREGGRVLQDHFSAGSAALRSPQAAQALEKLEGKSFDRLVAHSNGASITAGLIERDKIEVKELHVVGGDRAIQDHLYYQNLLDSGKVKRVVVWVNKNDPVPWGTSAIPVRSDEAALLGEHIARGAAGTRAAGDLKVNYMFMDGKPMRGEDGKLDPFRPHYMEKSYYPNIRKAYGTR
jgi:hypothetical protein